MQEHAKSIAAQASTLQPREFKDWLAKRQAAVDQIFETLIDTVERENVEPLAAARIAACVTGSVFGYEEFHPRGDAPAAEQMLDQDLLYGTNRSRELASR